MADSLSIEFEFRGRRFSSAEKGLEHLAKNHGLTLASATPVVRREMTVFMDVVGEALGRRHGGAWPGATSPAGQVPGTLSRRSGGLVRRLREGGRVTGGLEAGSEVRGTFVGSKIARVHEFGAVIRARRATYLTIPLRAALNDDGTPKRARARDWDRTFVARSRAGNLIIFRKVGRRDIVPLYVLKRSVRIPPRLGAGATLEKAAPAFVDAVIDALFKELTK